MSEWYRLGIGLCILIVLGVALSFWLVRSEQIRGEVWFMVTGGAFPTIHAYSLPDLARIPISLLPDIEFQGEMVPPYITDASAAPDGARAFLARKGGATQVMIDDGTGARAITDTKTLKRDLVWAPDGQSLAFSETATSTADRTNPDQWTVVRILRSGDMVSVGNGVHPTALPGPETVALTSKGIVSLEQGRAPKLLIASAIAVDRGVIAISATRIAWINPADSSLQIFERTETGTYTPVLLKKDFVASSLLFADARLLVTRASSGSTDVVAVSLDGTEEVLGTVPGTATLTAWTK